MNTESNDSKIIVIKIPASDLKLDFTTLSDDFKKSCSAELYESTQKSIYKAWTETAGIDKNGSVWIAVSKLHIILRIKPNTVRYYLDKYVKKKYKIEIEGKVYVKGTEVCRLIDQNIQSSKTARKEHYLRFSEKIYHEIRDSDKALNQRNERREHINNYRNELKRTRISKFCIVNDELTSQPLITKEHDFSHIRSVALYLDLADKIWNGLVINKQTHKIITQRDIYDEDGLRKLCIEKGWETNWYSAFIEKINEHE
jgi:hypothetical protein